MKINTNIGISSLVNGSPVYPYSEREYKNGAGKKVNQSFSDVLGKEEHKYGSNDSFKRSRSFGFINSNYNKPSVQSSLNGADKFSGKSRFSLGKSNQAKKTQYNKEYLKSLRQTIFTIGSDNRYASETTKLNNATNNLNVLTKIVDHQIVVLNDTIDYLPVFEKNDPQSFGIEVDLDSMVKDVKKSVGWVYDKVEDILDVDSPTLFGVYATFEELKDEIDNIESLEGGRDILNELLSKMKEAQSKINSTQVFLNKSQIRAYELISKTTELNTTNPYKLNGIGNYVSAVA